MASLELDKWDQDIHNPEADHQKLLDEIENAVSHSPNDVNYLWRASKQLITLANINQINKNKNKEKLLINLVMSYAKRAVKVDSLCFEAQNIYCASMGRMSELVGIRERVKCGHKFKKHSEMAFSLNSDSPNLYFLYYMCGVFCHKICSLSWLEKKLATTIYGALPQVTYEDALTALNKSNKLKPNRVPTNLWICKVLVAMNKLTMAIIHIETALEIEPKTADDLICHKELIDLDRYHLNYKHSSK